VVSPTPNGDAYNLSGHSVQYAYCLVVKLGSCNNAASTHASVIDLDQIDSGCGD